MVTDNPNITVRVKQRLSFVGHFRTWEDALAAAEAAVPAVIEDYPENHWLVFHDPTKPLAP